VSYNATTGVATLIPSSALVLNTTYTATVSGAADQSGNQMTAPVSWTFTTPTPITNATIWASSATPAVAPVNDPRPNELGFRFYSDAAGYITGLRFYQGPSNTGTDGWHLAAAD